jgi:hypothetical protein
MMASAANSSEILRSQRMAADNTPRDAARFSIIFFGMAPG